MTPAEEMRQAAKLMRELADAMERMVATWEPGYRDEVRASLGGPAGDMAAPWDQVTTRAVAEWLDVKATNLERVEIVGHHYQDHDSGYALAVARAFLDSSDD